MPAYVPILTGKQGEFDALALLPAETRAVLRPVLDLPPLKDDEVATEPIDRLLDRVAKAFGDKGALAVDLQALEQDRPRGAGAVRYLLDRVEWGAASGIGLAVRTDAPDPYIDAVAEHHTRSSGICVRTQVRPGLGPTELASDIDALLVRLGVTARETHLCLDCGSLLPWSAEPRPADVIAVHLDRDLGAFRLVSVAATSVPPNKEIRHGFDRFQRREWVAWRSLRQRGYDVVFGDYGITGLRPTTTKGALPDPHLRYTTDRALLIWRGWQPTRLPDERADEPASFPDLCREVIQHYDFAGPAFSHGDKAIADVAAGRRMTQKGEPTQGSTSQWVQWATSHHVAHIVDRVVGGS